MKNRKCIVAGMLLLTMITISCGEVDSKSTIEEVSLENFAGVYEVIEVVVDHEHEIGGDKKRDNIPVREKMFLHFADSGKLEKRRQSQDQWKDRDTKWELIEPDQLVMKGDNESGEFNLTFEGDKVFLKGLNRRKNRDQLIEMKLRRMGDNALIDIHEMHLALENTPFNDNWTLKSISIDGEKINSQAYELSGDISNIWDPDEGQFARYNYLPNNKMDISINRVKLNDTEQMYYRNTIYAHNLPIKVSDKKIEIKGEFSIESTTDKVDVHIVLVK